MIDCIFTHYANVLKRDSLYLKEITFCLNEQVEYFAFVNELREISDDLIRKGKIHSWFERMIIELFLFISI